MYICGKQWWIQRLLYREPEGTKQQCANNPNRLFQEKKRWAAMSEAQKQVILDRLKKHRELRKKTV